jgi:hypothetical protein
MLGALQFMHIEGHSATETGARMTTPKQRSAARRNIKKAGAAAKRKRTIAHLPKQTRTALGKQGAKVARQQRRTAETAEV